MIHVKSNYPFRRRLLLAILLLSASGVLAEAAPVGAAETTVRLTIDYSDGVQKSFVALPWNEKLTVFGALEAAARHARGIKVAHTGSGETTFVTAIDDRTNEGQGGSNWRYEVNGERLPVSAGVAELKAGDAIVWKFEK